MSLIAGKRRLLCRIGNNGTGAIAKYVGDGVFNQLFANPFPTSELITISYMFSVESNNPSLNHTYLLKSTIDPGGNTHDLSIAVLVNGVNANEKFEVFWSSLNGDLLDLNNNPINVGGINSITHTTFENRTFIIVSESEERGSSSRVSRVLELINSIDGVTSIIKQHQTLPSTTGKFDRVETMVIPTLGNVDIPYLFVSNSEDDNQQLTTTQAVVYRWSQTLDAFEPMQLFDNTTNVAGSVQLKPFRYWTGISYNYYFIARKWLNANTTEQPVYHYDQVQDRFELRSAVSIQGTRVSSISVFEHCEFTYIFVLNQPTSGSPPPPTLYKWNGQSIAPSIVQTYPIPQMTNLVTEDRLSVIFSIDDISPMMALIDQYGKTTLHKWDGLQFILTDTVGWKQTGFNGVDISQVSEMSYAEHSIGVAYV